ncbi:AbrB/MazE/SpoVT family DNA-binding domain-containing protein [Desulfurivibrio dismutans]|uniref:AbrB/MazE/SpoVT family DNA-binding domain-containing protein n=1 Tax=Desulfurivibrio dismutans TaxID=1398908 RepID=UPI0023DC54E5|nr:AbrB/MazE/SpoVT family DNA-binding domain-containing protein [Desulfurivibrio alkaliphilus]MDF1613681.1 AbrB/MazE/SpoVT family DNA-binding domain-containing protein [Desulfurivibrio alkaliphilus]
MAAIAKVTAKGQTNIPREIRETLHVKPGDLITWEKSADGVVQIRNFADAGKGAAS